MKLQRTAIALVVSVLFLYLAFRQSDFDVILKQILAVKPGPLLASLVVLFLAYLSRTFRWRVLLLPTGRPSLNSLFGAIMIGFMSLNLLPFRLGEFIRAYVLGRKEGLSKSTVFATIVVERIFDGFTILLIGLAGVAFLPLLHFGQDLGWIKFLAVMGGLLYLTALVGVILIRVKRELIIRLASFLLQWTPRLRVRTVAMIGSFAEGLATISSFRALVEISFFSLLVWGLTAVSYWLIMFSFSAGGVSLGTQVGYAGSLFLLAVLALGVMVPAGPAFVGTYELACVAGLAALGHENVAQSYALVAHAIQFFPVTLVGIGYLYFQHFSFKEIQAGGEEVAED